MADDKIKKPDPATLPGGEKFDVDNAPQEEYDKHFAILKRRADIAGLTPPAAPVPVTVVDAAATGKAEPASLADSEIIAVHPELGTRGFSKLTWDSMADKRGHSGWEVKVEKPEPLQIND